MRGGGEDGKGREGEGGACRCQGRVLIRMMKSWGYIGVPDGNHVFDLEYQETLRTEGRFDCMPNWVEPKPKIPIAVLRRPKRRQLPAPDQD